TASGTVIENSPVVTSGSYNLTMNNLNSGTTYYVNSFATNSKGTAYGTEKTFTTTGTAPIEYCTSEGSNYSYEWISNIEIGTFSNSSDAAGYSDYTNQTLNLTAGESYDITLTPSFSGSSYDEYWKIWIDLNYDGDFDDANENVFDAESMSKTAVTGTITIPVDNADVTTRMRVTMKYNGAPTACESSFDYGEVEDYHINISQSSGGDTEAPTAPTNLSSSNITETTFTLSWNASSDNEGVSAYDIYKNGTLLASTANTSYNVSGLTEATSYSFYVKAKDDAGNISDASSTLNVTTATTPDTEAPTAPGNLTSSNVTESSATLSWDASSDNEAVNSYDIYKDGSYLANTSSLNYSVTGLSSATTYSFYVKAKDDAGNVSDASSSISVTTDDVVAEYCSSRGNNYSYEWISKVEIGTYSNTSNAAAYTDFTSENITLEAGTSVDINLTPAFSGSTYNEYWKFWIDYNNDKVFDETTELVFDAGSLSKSAVSGTITIPSSATGTTRMRVSMKYNGEQTPCEAFSYGEVEDYSVTFGEAIPDTDAPSIPANLVASNITQTSATISWDASNDNVGVDAYEVFKNGISQATVSSTTYNASGLSAATSYEYTVKAKDEAGNTSAASNVLSFTTSNEELNYCSTKGNNVNYEWIDLVELGSINNTTAADGGYADYTNLSTNLTLGAETTIYLSCGFNSSSYTEYWHVWIDYDHSGTFDSDEEMVAGSSSSDAKLSASFTVPTDALLGATRMRVTMKYNAAATACETFSYGEVEDYTVNITGTMSSYFTKNASNATVLGNEDPTSIKVYPIPANNYINVEVVNGIKYGAVNIYNINGMLVKAANIQGNETEINISKLPAGSYIIRIDDEKEAMVKRFIKN
ncbi:MAG: GEVED domain-containing protein, partial [Bacteroidota bacterium]|nr:GEVED domain-containing protein [Bacteroidota bacterium]